MISFNQDYPNLSLQENYTNHQLAIVILRKTINYIVLINKAYNFLGPDFLSSSIFPACAYPISNISCAMDISINR